MSNTKILWQEMYKNLLWAILLFGGLLGILYGVEIIWPALSGKLLAFNDNAFLVGIPASVIGVGYVLTVRNPNNYIAFYGGIIMSALLGIQFALNGVYDLTFLYFLVFIPFQIIAILSWKKSDKNRENQELVPKFFTNKMMLLNVLVFVLIVVADYFFATYVMRHDTLNDDIAEKIVGGTMIASSFLANYWLIYKKTDSWIYWLIYSVAGVAMNVFYINIFSLVLFVFFLVINGIVAIAWFKATSKENYGWLRIFCK